MASRPRILVIDDEPLVLDMFESVFREHEYEVSVAQSAREAVKRLERVSFDVVVCDVMMEELDGFDVAAVARSKSNSVGIVLVTGAPSSEDERRARENDIYYLSKPVGFDTLIGAVRDCLSSNRGEIVVGLC